MKLKYTYFGNQEEYDEAVIEYEYIPESEELYFNEVYFSGSTYPLDTDMSSESCYEAIMKSFN